ncbi:MAG: MBL fold metallo-hydrolase [Myxococcota bacterium]|nr:MBL fold metallo-hydrolase [Myxococcota bacterium]
MKVELSTWIIIFTIAFLGCTPEPMAPKVVPAPGDLNDEIKPASDSTRAANAAVLERLPFEDVSDFELANRGFIAGPDALVIDDEDGRRVWDMTVYDFITGEAPDTVNPSLWRQARLNNIHGLFEVVDGIYQVRGYDLSNVSFIRGETGWIVVDPLISVEAARAALDLVNEELGARPVVAVIYSHSHADHFGGVRGVTTPEEVASGRVRILAPEGFSHHAVSENVLAGNVMTRRAEYMFGGLLEPGPQGRVDTGLGKTTSRGRVSMIPPTDIIGETTTTIVIDGVEMIFQYTPNAEAPAEMMFYFPQWKAFCVAEEANAVFHNLYTVRGAQVRSGKDWAAWLEEAIELFGDDLELVFGSHHWPRWGREEAIEYLEGQRDLYAYVHDQTLRLANSGLTPREIAETLELPASLGQRWYNRDYYGTVRHNSKATYQYYLGWFDGNPARLSPLPPVEGARRYVEWMGGADAMIQKGKSALAKGEYRWVAEVMNHLVFAEPENQRARWLQADALEQMGYQAESGPWRNFYLSGAQELRSGIAESERVDTASSDVIAGMTSAMVFDFMAVRLKGLEAADAGVVVQIRLTDRGELWVLDMENGVLHAREGRPHPDPDVALEISRPDFLGLISGQVGLPALLARGRASLSGNPLALATFGGLFEQFERNFEIVRP